MWKNSFIKLLIGLILYLFISPFLVEFPAASLLSHLWLTLVLFLTAWTVEGTHKKPKAFLLVVPALLFYWLNVFHIVSHSGVAALCLFILFYLFIITKFTKKLIKSQTVNADLIAGALCLYLIIGLLWGSAYHLLYALDPSTFSGNLLDTHSSSPTHIFNYFSMVTLTSLGYGDITPQSMGAASLCQIQAIIGQFFTAVLVGWLVGMFGKPLHKNSKQPSNETTNS